MKLSELVKINQTLQNIHPSQYELQLNQSLTSLLGTLENTELMSKDVKKSIINAREDINDQFATIRLSLNEYRQYINNCIQREEHEYFELSNLIYEDTKHDNAEYILNRIIESKTFALQQVLDLFISRLGLYNSWKYPGLQIRPATGQITDYIKGCDPLYLLDTEERLFDKVKTKWNRQYQGRLRYYTFDESESNIFSILPDNQFGLIVAVDYFNFKPLELLQKYLEEFYAKLRPGGVAVFTYNNCDLPYGVQNVENKFCCYTPGRLVKQTAKIIGFEIVKDFNSFENISWFELRKPGEPSSLRGGQALGKIVNPASDPLIGGSSGWMPHES